MGLLDDPYVDDRILCPAGAGRSGPPGHGPGRRRTVRGAGPLRNENGLLPLDATALGSVAVIGPLADSPRDTLGPWVFDFDLDETVTVLAGVRARAGGDRSGPGAAAPDHAVRVGYARGVPVVQREFPSLFDMFGGNTPSDPDGFDDDAEFGRAVDLAADADVPGRSSWWGSGRT